MTNWTNELLHELRSALGDIVTFADDGSRGSYGGHNQGHYSQQEDELSPRCVIRPLSTHDVARVIEYLASLNITSGNGHKFAVRSGGHAPFSGHANIDDGVTIDLRFMNHMVLSDDETSISIGPGATWGEVYKTLESKNLTVVGGRVSNVGVGGLLLGGGLSFYSAQYGFACDNVLNYELVLASGKIVEANANENPDLWRALRGGVNNFGVVTKFVLKTIPCTNHYGGIVMYDISTTEDQIQAFYDFADESSYDNDAAIIQSFAYTNEMYLISDALQYTKPIESPESLKPFLRLQPQLMGSMRIEPQSSFTDEQVRLSPQVTQRQLFQTTTFKRSLTVLHSAVAIWRKSVATVRDIPGIVWCLGFQPLPPSITGKSATLGGNSLGLENQRSSLVIALLVATWSNASDDDTIYKTADVLFEEIDEVASKEGMDCAFRYTNYAPTKQKSLESYGEREFELLRRTAEIYDPTGLFQEAVPGGPKLLF